MTTALLVAALVQPDIALPTMREFPIAGANRVSVTIVVPAPPDMTGRHLAAWYAIGDTLLASTEEFSREAIWDYGTQAGIPPRVQVLPDLIIVQVSAPPAGLDVAAHIATSLVRRPKLRDTDLAASVARRQSQRDAWSVWAEPRVPDWTRMDRRSLDETLGAAFQPNRMFVCIGGAVKPGDGIAEVTKQFARGAAIPSARIRPGDPPRIDAKIPGHVSLYEWTGPALRASEPGFIHRLVALMALGVGKEGAITRILREDMGLTYRQELVLWPTAQGWQPRLIAWRAGAEDPIAEIEAAGTAVKADIEKWNEATLQRAKAMLRTALVGDGLFQPFWIGPNEILGASVEDRTAFWALAAMAGGERLTPEFIGAALESLDLERLKAEGNAVLDQASAGVRPAEIPFAMPSEEAFLNSGSR
jgi:hypothetical protein